MDDSDSMDISDDIGFITRKKIVSNFIKENQTNFDRLKENYELEFIKFSTEEQNTSIGSSLKQVLTRHLTTNIAGVLLLSDGRNNSGESIERVIRQLQERKVPVHTYCIGKSAFDENITDASLTKIDSPKVIQRHNGLKLNIEGQLHGIKTGDDVPIEIFLNDNFLKTHKVTKETINFKTQIDVELDNLDAGYHKLTAKIQSPGRDLAEQNNSLDTYFEISDRQIQVLVISTSPSPELKFLNRFLNAQANIVSSSNSPYFYHSPEGHAFLNSIKFKDFDVIVFQAADLKVLPRRFLERCSALTLKNRQGLIFSGAESLPNLQKSGYFKEHLPLTRSSKLVLKEGQVTPTQKGLSHFISQDISLKDWSEYVNNSQISTPADTLFHLNNTPLLASNEVKNCRSLWLNTSKLWQMYTNQSYKEAYNQLWYKMILYASSRDKLAGEELVLYSDKLNVEQGRTIELSIYNELDKQAQKANSKVTLESISPSGQSLKQDYELLDSNSLKITLPLNEVGAYKFKVSNSSISSLPLKIFVSENKLEMKNLLANHDLMKKISEFTNGFAVEQADTNEFFYYIRSHSNTKFSTKTMSKTSLWDNLLTYLLICLLFTSEWIARRKLGLP